MAHLTIDNNGFLIVSCDYSQKNIVKDMGARWDADGKVWILACTPEKVDVLFDELEQVTVDERVEQRIKREFDKREILGKYKVLAKDDHPVRFKVPGLKLPLYNYQKLGAMFAITNGDGVLIADEMGLGKAQPLDEKILTPSGWRRMGEIRRGDEVIGADGTPTVVTGVYPQGMKRTYRVVFSDGSSARCCEDHLWSVNTPTRKNRGQPFLEKSLNEIVNLGLTRKNGRNGLRWNWFVPMVEPVHFSRHADLVILHPYVLGVLLGDGVLSSGRLNVSSSDMEIVDRCVGLLGEGWKVTSCGGCDYNLSRPGFSSNEPVHQLLINFGLKGSLSHENVPSSYLFAPIEDRLELLRGLMDTDGTVGQGKRGNVAQFCSVSEFLRDAVVFLARSLGGSAIVSEKRPFYYRDGVRIDGKKAWIVTLSLPSGMQPFWLKRKAELYPNERVKYPPVRAITEVQQVGFEEVQCIRVSAPDGLYVTSDFVVTHNTVQGLAVALYLKHKGQAQNCLVVTPASLKFNWPIEIEKFTDEPFVVVDGSSEERVAQWLRDDVFFKVVNYELILEDLFGGRRMEVKKGETEKQRERRESIVRKAEARRRILESERKRIWDLVIVDELHYIKNPSSARARNIKKLRGKTRIGLTGTPLDGRLEELHSVMDFVMPGLMISRPRFMQRHTVVDFWGRVTGYKRKDEVKELIAPYFLRRLKRDVLKDLPEKVYENRTVLLSPQERRVYDKLAKRGHEVTENAEAMVAVIRCKQFCDLPSLVDSKVLKSSKMDALKEVLDEVIIENGNKALIFSQYAEVAEQILALLEVLGLKYLYLWGKTPQRERALMQKEFNEGDTQVMVGTEAMSLGLNLQSASYVINYDDNWAPAVMKQREDRCLDGNQVVCCLRSVYDGRMAIKTISEIEVGDTVLTCSGKEARVTWKGRTTNVDGRMTRIRYVGWPEPIECTFDHKWLVRRKGRVEEEWIAAHEILPCDSLLLPRPSQSERLDFVEVKNSWRRFRGNVSDVCVVDGCKEGIEAREMCRIHYREWLKQTHKKDRPKGNFRGGGRYISLPDKIEIDDEWLFVLGWFAAEGFSSISDKKSDFVSLSGNVSERSILERCGDVFSRLGVGWSIYGPRKNAIELRAYSTELAHWFRDWFGHGARNKRLPREIQMLPPEQAKVVLDAYVDGDGYRRSGRNNSEWVSASRELAYQFCFLAAKCGHAPTLRKGSRNSWVGSYSGSGTDEMFLERKVRSVESYYERRPYVYDISVDRDESFVTGFATAHNCHRHGQKDTVTVVNFVCVNTVEERIRQVLFAKNKVTNEILGDETEESILMRLGPQDMAKLL